MEDLTTVSSQLTFTNKLNSFLYFTNFLVKKPELEYKTSGALNKQQVIDCPRLVYLQFF